MALISPLSIAPMIDWTYTHFRVFMRILAPHVLLYTDMQTPGAIINRAERALYFHESEQPLALQLGGVDAALLAECAERAWQCGFAEVNLNLGCPSDRVQAGRFGACLMAEPEYVAHCIAAMKAKVSIPVTAKIRIGIDHQDSYTFFAAFVKQLLDAGCDKIIVHARKAWLHGLSPKQNRTIPPLKYDYVYQIKQDYPDIPIVINGNIQELESVHQHLEKVDGVMLGRLACQNPYAIAKIHHGLFPEIPLLSRYECLKKYLNYMFSIKTTNIPMSFLLKPIMNIAHGLPNARSWKNLLLNVQQHGNVKDLLGVIEQSDLFL